MTHELDGRPGCAAMEGNIVLYCTSSKLKKVQIILQEGTECHVMQADLCFYCFLYMLKSGFSLMGLVDSGLDQEDKKYT